MSLEKEIIQLLENFRDTQCDGKAKLAAKYLNVTEPTFSRWVNGSAIPKVESLIIPFERLKARIVVGNAVNNEEPGRRLRELEDKVKELKELLDAKEEIIRLQKELMATPKSAAPIKRALETGPTEWENPNNGDCKTPEPGGQEDRPPAGEGVG